MCVHMCESVCVCSLHVNMCVYERVSECVCMRVCVHVSVVCLYMWARVRVLVSNVKCSCSLLCLMFNVLAAYEHTHSNPSRT